MVQGSCRAAISTAKTYRTRSVGRVWRASAAFFAPCGQTRITAAQQIVETVNEQLAGQFNLEQNRPHSFWGLCARLYSKLTAHTLCIYLNRLLGKADFPQIKQLAF